MTTIYFAFIIMSTVKDVYKRQEYGSGARMRMIYFAFIIMSTVKDVYKRQEYGSGARMRMNDNGM
ncbi:hypothetical protein DEO72_LG6g863 [Vigna unguiculata]|uniref:Uncharacterized protein n=1 Tax=Vigna unguiculata TaxID=3917 RepID=A0A4D6M6Y9_VIGUN|nr:hypothetical protein DEO72_LG6g863 [Vigna unguiculata]